MLKKLENLLKAEIDPAFAKRAKFIFEEIEKEKPKKILDAGCGRGFYLYALTFFPFIKEIHGVDINEAYLSIARSNLKDSRIKILRGSVYKLPYKKNYFDLIICSEVLEHLENDTKALFELKGVLKKKGLLIITVPNYRFSFLWDPLNWVLMRFFNTHINKNIWWLAGIWADHERLYTREEIIRKTQSRFIVRNIELLTNWCWPFSHFLLYGIGKNLVQRLNVEDFNRFNFRSKNRLPRLVSNVFCLPTRLLDNLIRTESSVNIVVVAKK